MDSDTDMDAIIILAGMSDALIGVSERWGEVPKLVYDKEKVLELLILEDGLSPEEAEEHFYFNVLGTWMGEGSPIFITDFRNTV